MLNELVFKDISNPIRGYLERSDVYDLCINKPQEVYLLTANGWEIHQAELITEQWCKSFIQATSNYAAQTTDKNSPILSAELLSGERIQAIIPPACRDISITIRRPQSVLIPIKQYKDKGLLKKSRSKEIIEKADVIEAKKLYDSVDSIEECLEFCILNKLNIIFSGATGSGKTTIANTISQFIPDNERLVTIEDSAEINLKQQNVVNLFYPRNKKNPVVTPDELLASCMRMSPSRIIFGELRGAEAFFYIDQINTGHRGSITTIHANSGRKALKRMVKLIKRSDEGKGFSSDELTEDLREEIDVIFQWHSHGIDHAYFPAIED